MKSRIQSVDALRGLVMIIMALDHVRDFFSAAANVFLPDDVSRTTTALFFTRWITHICAPTFMFTAGLAAFFWMNNGRTRAQLSRFLWTRGLWLIVLELTVLRFALSFTFSGPVLLTILWALGWSMISLALLVHLPARGLAILSIAAIALHNLLDPIQASQFGRAAWLWDTLHQQAAFTIGPLTAVSAYPLVPWMFVMALGFCFGPVVLLDPASRRKWMVRIGSAMVAAFVILRAIDIYGDPFKRAGQARVLLAFLRTTKYPPSLDFVLMTIGPALLLMAWLDTFTLSKNNPLLIFGRVPLFYFMVHLYLARSLTIPLGANAYGLPAVYAIWIAVVIAMYPLCLWFARLKQRRNDWWLSYL